jgi:hypothetical protein
MLKYLKSSLNNILYIINIRGCIRVEVNIIYKDISNYFIISNRLIIN